MKPTGKAVACCPMARPARHAVSVNCAAEAETLLEDQLFGHVRGAFTGAEKDREGVFGKYSIDPNGDITLTPYGVYKIADGALAFDHTIKAAG